MDRVLRCNPLCVIQQGDGVALFFFFFVQQYYKV